MNRDDFCLKKNLYQLSEQFDVFFAQLFKTTFVSDSPGNIFKSVKLTSKECCSRQLDKSL